MFAPAMRGWTCSAVSRRCEWCGSGPRSVFPLEAGHSWFSGPATPALRIQRSISRAMAEELVTAERMLAEVKAVVAEQSMGLLRRGGEVSGRSEVQLRQRCSPDDRRLRFECASCELWLTYFRLGTSSTRAFPRPSSEIAFAIRHQTSRRACQVRLPLRSYPLTCLKPPAS